MKSIMFHLNNLTFRGTTTAVIDYATYNQSILNNKSIISYPKNLLGPNDEINSTRRFEIAEFFRNNFDTIEYENKEELKSELDNRGCEYVHYLKAGMMDNDYLEGKINLIHCVFNHYQPHGHRYAYISNWLKNHATANDPTFNYVPHIVTLPENQTEDLRERLGIDKSKTVVGRHGGFHEFDIIFAQEVVKYILSTDNSFVFLFLNTNPFIYHPNVIYLDSVFDPQDKTNFILACDIMLQARSLGESFGLSICEGLFHNKPVLSFGGGPDKHNVELTEKYNLIYNNPNELYQKLMELKNGSDIDYKSIVEQFSPVNVMNKFNEVFLK